MEGLHPGTSMGRYGNPTLSCNQPSRESQLLQESVPQTMLSTPTAQLPSPRPDFPSQLQSGSLGRLLALPICKPRKAPSSSIGQQQSPGGHISKSCLGGRGVEQKQGKELWGG